MFFKGCWIDWFWKENSDILLEPTNFSVSIDHPKTTNMGGNNCRTCSCKIRQSRESTVIIVCHQIASFRVIKIFINPQCVFCSEYILYSPPSFNFTWKQSTVCKTIRRRFFLCKLISLTPQDKNVCQQNLNTPMKAGKQHHSKKVTALLLRWQLTHVEKLLNTILLIPGNYLP